MNDRPELPPVRMTRSHPMFPQVFMLLEKYAFLKNPDRWMNGKITLEDGQRVNIFSAEEAEKLIQDVYDQIAEALEIARLPLSILNLVKDENYTELLKNIDGLDLSDLIDQNPP